MQLNIRDFCLSISEETLDKAISFTLNQTTVLKTYVLLNIAKSCCCKLERKKKAVAALM